MSVGVGWVDVQGVVAAGGEEGHVGWKCCLKSGDEVCEEGNNERVDGSMLDSLEVEGNKTRFIGEGKAFKVAPNACLDTNVIVISEV